MVTQSIKDYAGNPNRPACLDREIAESFLLIPLAPSGWPEEPVPTGPAGQTNKLARALGPILICVLADCSTADIARAPTPILPTWSIGPSAGEFA